MSKANKILICTGIFPPDIGGPASYAHTMVSALSEHGFDVAVLTYANGLKSKIPPSHKATEGHSKNQKLKLQTQNQNKSYKIVKISRRWPKGLRHLIYFFKTASLAKKADVIFALNSVTAGWPAAFWAKRFKKRFIVKVVGDYAWESAVNKGRTRLLIDDFQKSRKTGMTRALHKLQVQTCVMADRIIVPSEYLACIVRGWGVVGSRVAVVYNGSDFKPSGLKKEGARKRIGVPGNIILSVGRLVPWEGFKMLIKIMPRLLEINQFFRLVIIGGGPEYKKLKAMIKNMNLEKKTVLAGPKSKDDLAVYFAAADIFALNTGYEGFSHQLIEAMTAGVPVITTAAGGNREIIHQGENGFMVKYNDEFNLMEAIKTVWTAPELRDRFIEEGKKTAEYFNVEKMTEETIDVMQIYK